MTQIKLNQNCNLNNNINTMCYFCIKLPFKSRQQNSNTGRSIADGQAGLAELDLSLLTYRNRYKGH